MDNSPISSVCNFFDLQNRAPVDDTTRSGPIDTISVERTQDFPYHQETVGSNTEDISKEDEDPVDEETLDVLVRVPT